MFLSKINVLDVPEPFSKLRNQGMILSQDGKKMSKSRGNIVDPLSFLISHGADALRLHEKFLGPFFADVK
ncbi:MAG: class I tRNA ligase family protein [Mollicutes bacterium]|nr:MAG: class I tRNA ligase family protein [Mollicutes bacterium]